MNLSMVKVWKEKVCLVHGGLYEVVVRVRQG
jgi:hypothetical protein